MTAAASQPKFDAFISYSHVDKATADATCAMLERDGIRCWIAPRDIVPGVEWGAAIIRAIDQCRVMVLIFSSNANNSKQIRREVERAVNAGVTIIPVRIEDATPTDAMAYFMSTVHWLDAMSGPLESHLQRLAGTIKTLLSAAPASPAPVAQPTARTPVEAAIAADTPPARRRMFQDVMNFAYQRTRKQAFGWYLMYLAIGVVLGFAVGRIAGIAAGTFEEGARLGLIAGQVSAIPFHVALGIALLWHRAKDASNIMLVLLAVVLSVVAGSLGGLIPLAVITGRPVVKPLPRLDLAHMRI
jgi:hypothetical protein